MKTPQLMILTFAASAFSQLCGTYSVAELRENRSLNPAITGEINPRLNGCVSPELRGNIGNLQGCITTFVKGDASNINGMINYISGDVSFVRGNITGTGGDVTGLHFDVDKCNIDGSKWIPSTYADVLYGYDVTFIKNRYMKIWINQRYENGCKTKKIREVFDCQEIGYGTSISNVKSVNPDEKFYSIIKDACLFHQNNEEWLKKNQNNICNEKS